MVLSEFPMTRNIQNRLAIAAAYLRRRPELKAVPFEIQIGITNRCNLACEFCPHRLSTRPQGDISPDLLDHLLSQVAPYVDTVDLSFDGEPFLHPRWPECVEACRSHRILAMLETNATLLDESLAREVLKAGVGSITFSIDAARAETFEKLKPGGDYEQVVENVERFLRLARNHPERPYIQIQFVKTPGNAHEAADFVRRWKGKGADAVHVKPMLNFGGSVGPPPSRPARLPCLFLWSSLSIQWDGTVPLCCLEIEGRTDMADASRTPIRDIVDNQAFQEIRELHASGRYREHPVCRNCTVPSVSWPFVVGSVFVGDLSRRKLINQVERFVPLGG